MNKLDYIKREDAAELIRSYCKDLISKGKCDVEVTEFNSDIQKKLSEIPVTEVVKVVRCKDCEFAEITETNTGAKYFDCKWHDGYMEADDFCSYGKQVER